VFEQKDLPALEKALKDYQASCTGALAVFWVVGAFFLIANANKSEVRDIGNKLGAELRRMGEVVADNEWGAARERREALARSLCCAVRSGDAHA
jgi:hypothetical protein